jgi:hypothetical protein
MESVYLETTFFGYLVSRPSRDLLVVAQEGYEAPLICTPEELMGT